MSASNKPRMEGGTEAFAMVPYASWLPNQMRGVVLLVREGARPTAKHPFAALLHRIMAKPALSILCQPRHYFPLADQRVALRGEDAVECPR